VGVRLTPAARGLRRHRQVALWCAPVLLILALSGVLQAFPIAATAVPAPATHDSAAAFDAVWSRLEREYPGWRLLQWRAGAPARLEIVEAGAPHDYAISTSYHNPVTGAALQRLPYEQSTAARKAYLWGLALHYGAAGGPAWQLAQFAAALTVPFLAWTGVAAWLRRHTAARGEARQQLLLRCKNNVARDVCAFEFVHPRGRKLPAWTAGAHIDVHIAPGLVRQYSLCGDPRDRSRYLIAVHRCTPSRGGSHAMHDALRIGYRVTLGMPRNQFALRAGSPHTVLLAGGIGITPLLAMAETLAAAGASFELHYCTRSPVHAAFSERLHQRRFGGRVMFHFSHTSGRADFDAILAAPRRGAQLYICGAAGFMDAALAAAARQGWPAASVHTERFSAPAGCAAGDTQAAFDVVIASSGRVVHVAAGRSALAALRDAGISIPTSCGQGICGACVTGVLEGEPDHRDHCLAEEARATCFTPCCSRSRGPQLVLDL
jgi:vanillate O-demethylase ferredoxin subunit